MDSAHDLTGTVVGKYLVERKLGEGAMGAVYAARHALTDKEVALKFMLGRRPGARERLLREARAAARVKHPNLLDIYDVEEHEGQLYLIMERLRGDPLSAVLTAGPLDAADAVDLLMPALRGVHAGHLAGVVHRDLKPDNLFVCHDGAGRTVKVLDFGISKLLFESGAVLTREGMALGTPAYMAPEQLTGRPVDARADQYALAGVLFEMVEGAPPYHDRASIDALLASKLAGALPMSRPHPPALVEALHRALDGDPDARFASVEDFAHAVEGVGRLRFDVTGASAPFPGLGTSPRRAAVAEPPRTARSASRRARAAAILGASIVAAGIVVATAVLLRSGAPPTPTVIPLPPATGTPLPAATAPPAPNRAEPPAPDVAEPAAADPQPAAAPEVEPRRVVAGPRPRRTAEEGRSGTRVELRSGTLGAGDL